MEKENLYVMSDEEYKKLNSYLNEIFNFLSGKDGFLIENIDTILWTNAQFLSFMSDYKLSNETKTNNLTDEQVICIAREIIASINNDYLEEFDRLLVSEKLKFDCEGKSVSHSNPSDGSINISRKFNYHDVLSLVHEFMHTTNVSSKETKNRYSLTEFLSIYFEMYAIDYLLERGIPKEEIGVYERLSKTCLSSKLSFEILPVFLAFIKFGDIHKNTFSDLNKNFLPIHRLDFVRKCKLLLLNCLNLEEDYRKQIAGKKQFGMQEFISGLRFHSDYRYVLGTILAFYARSYCKIEDIVFLNNHINDDDISSLDLLEVLKRIGIDITNSEFIGKALESIGSYIKQYSNEKNR